MMARTLGLALASLAALVAFGVALPAGASHQASLNGCTSKQAQAGTLTSPFYDLSGPSIVHLKFWYWWEIESVDPTGHDLMTVEMSTDGGTMFSEVAKLNPVDPATGGDPSFPLSNKGLRVAPGWQSFDQAVAGLASDVRLRFSFDSRDSLFNGFRGFAVDDVRFEASPEPGPPVGGPLADFEFNPDAPGGIQPAFPPGWTASRFWNRPASPENTAIASDIKTNLIQLGSGDSGLLPGDPNGTTYAWFGEVATGTFCGADYAKNLTVAPSESRATVGTQVRLDVASEALAPDTVLRWHVSGANEGVGGTAVLDGSGAAAISYTGANGGSDTVTMFADENRNGESDAGELAQAAHVSWYGLTMTPTSASRTLGEVQALTAQVAGDSGSGPVVWSVSGANPQPPQALQPDLEGRSGFSYAGQSAGTDTVHAFFDADSSGTREVGEPAAAATITWSAPQSTATLTLDPASAAPTIGRPHTITATAAHAGGTVRFAVSGANPTSGAVPVDPATGRASFTYTGANPGADSVSAHLDVNGDGAQDAGEPTGGAAVNWRNRSELPPDIPTADRIEDLPPPPPFRAANFAPVGGGQVLVLLPSGGAASPAQSVEKRFIPLQSAAQLPVGSVLNTNQGRVAIRAAARRRGPSTSSAQFYRGTFRFTQPRGRTPVTEMTMRGGSFRSCTKSKSRRGASKSQRRRTVRRLWGSGKGRFRTRGRYSAATVRGTTWLVEDRCEGTLTRVRSGTVQVRDFPRRRTVTVRAGRSHLALRVPPRDLGKR